MLDAYKRHQRQKFLVEVLMVVFATVLVAIPVSVGFAIFTGEWRFLLIALLCLWIIKS